MEIEEVLAEQPQLLTGAQLRTVSLALQRWVDTPLSPTPLAVLLSLRHVFTLARRTFTAICSPPRLNGEDPETETDVPCSQQALGSQGSRGAGRKRKPREVLALSERGRTEADENRLEAYEGIVEVVQSFGRAAALGLFSDTVAMESLVSNMVHLLQLEVQSPVVFFGSGSRERSPLAEAAFGTLQVMLTSVPQSGAEGARDSPMVPNGVALPLGPGDYARLVLPAAVPFLFPTFAGVLTPALVGLRKSVLKFLAELFAGEVPLSVRKQDLLCRLLIQICTQVKAHLRSELRKNGAVAVLQLFGFFPGDEAVIAEDEQVSFKARFIRFLLQLSLSNEDKQRHFVVEIASGIICQCYSPAEASTPRLGAVHTFELLEVLLLRCSDLNAPTRREALGQLASIFELTKASAELKEKFQEFLSLQADSAPILRQQAPSGCDVEVSTHRELLIFTVMCRIKEESAWVRKSSIQVLELLLWLEDVNVNSAVVAEAIIERAQVSGEDSVLVRTHAVSCLAASCVKCIEAYVQSPNRTADVLRGYMEFPVKLLSEGIFPAFARDHEDSVKNISLKAVRTILFDPLEKHSDPRLPCVWEILSRLSHDALYLLSRAAVTLAMAKEIPPAAVQGLQSAIKAGETCPGAFELLASLGGVYRDKLDREILLRCYENHRELLSGKSFSGVEVMAQVLKLLTLVELPSDQAGKLSSDLVTAIMGVTLHHSLISHAMSAVVILGKKKAKEEVERVFQHAQEKLHEFIKHGTLRGMDAAVVYAAVTKHILVIGEAALLRDKGHHMVKIPRDVETYLHAIVQTGTDVSPSRETSMELTQEMTQASGTTVHIFQSRGLISQCVENAAYLTLGKLCLASDATAKRFLCVFVNQLQKSGSETVKVNILASLIDLAVEYAGCIDKYVSVIARCFGDPSVLVRHTALVLMTQALAENFLKWRSTLFFSFLVTLADPDKVVSRFAEGALVKVLLPKQRGLFFNNFVETLFVLSKYEGHPSYNKTVLHSSVYGLAEEEHAAKRLAIYKVLLTNMSQQHIYTLHQKLHTEVLALCTEEAAASGSEPGSEMAYINTFTPSGSVILTDTLTILMSKEMRLSTRIPQCGVCSTDVDDAETGSAALTDFNRKVYAEMLRKHIEVTVIPVLVELKRWLQRKRSPHLRLLCAYLQLIVREYPTEVQNLLASDPQLAVELQYDLRQRQRQQRLSLGRKSSPHPGNISPPPPLDAVPSGASHLGACEGVPTPRSSGSFRVPTTPLTDAPSPSVKRQRLSGGSVKLESDTVNTNRALFE
eukprot:RCo016976